jgi:Mn2+/Fe2+ NRAMP family transporter
MTKLKLSQTELAQVSIEAVVFVVILIENKKLMVSYHNDSFLRRSPWMIKIHFGCKNI